ncbi:hypothetical protein ACEWY4_022947 [Coilia grayii]|uniref:Spindle and kinetochore-associated protein 3 n=1 Tax=Coilia grayii TaxID=363190 RepID=A0ABD1J1L3_9TELE
MEPREKFFTKLRHLVGHLEKETEHLQDLTENQNDDTSEGACLSTLHKLKSDVRELTTQVQQEIVKSQEERMEDLGFIHMYSKKREQMNEALDTLGSYLEQYGYKPRQPAQKPPESVGEEEKDLEQETGEEEQDEEAAEEEEEEDQVNPVGQNKDQGQCTPEGRAPPSLDQEMRTPKLSDFGLSELHLQNMLRNCGVAEAPLPPPPKLLHSPLATMTVPPPVPKTPKCYLKLDEDAPTPRLEDFGISEHTMCLINDFTMDLVGKTPAKSASRFPANETPVRASSTEFMDTPETPEIQTPGFSLVKKALACTPLQSHDSLESPQRQTNDLTSPQVPTFQTPYLSKLLSVHKDVKSKDSTTEMPGPNDATACPPDGSSPHSSMAEDIPEMPARLCHDNDMQRTPEMPTLQSFLGRSLQSRYSAMGSCSLSVVSRQVDPAPTLDLNENQTQEWNLASPRVRMEYDCDARTPEMPEMSSITQDIFKLVSQCNTEMKSAASQPPLKAALQTSATGKENRQATHSQRLALVTEVQFDGLTTYLKQVSLARLNEAIQELNTALLQRQHGGHSNLTEFLMSELRSIIGSGVKLPLVLMCLTELKRVQLVHGAGNSALYQLLPTQT